MINSLGRLKNLVTSSVRSKFTSSETHEKSFEPLTDGFVVSGDSCKNHQNDMTRMKILKGSSGRIIKEKTTGSTISGNTGSIKDKTAKVAGYIMLGLSVAGAVGGAMAPIQCNAGGTIQHATHTSTEQNDNRSYDTSSRGASMTWDEDSGQNSPLFASAQSAGVSSEVISHFQNSESGPGKMQNLLDEVHQNFGSISQRQKDFLSDGFNGKTRILFVTVSHRDAFVKGEAVGKNIFPMIQDKIDQGMNDGKLTLSEANELRDQVQRAEDMTPRERQLVAEAFTGLYNREKTSGMFALNQ